MGQDHPSQTPSGHRHSDILFALPSSVYHHFTGRTGNIQSHILQEVKRVLEDTFPNTDARGDGPVILVPFTPYAVEVVPAFALTSGQLLDLRGGGDGKFKTFDPNGRTRPPSLPVALPIAVASSHENTATSDRARASAVAR